jgi:hypothetical protein
LSDTGDIDINKLAGYKFDDNIFRKVMMTPKGKNHGLVLLIDKSGSMNENMAGSIEQILVLAMFCRKVNIPFVVYGFGDSIEAKYCDLGINQSYEKQNEYNKSNKLSFEKKEKNLAFTNVYLREYINNKMTNAEFNNALRNMILLKKSYEGGRYMRSVGRPDSEHLSNTPLTQAIIATAEVMKNFKQVNNLDLTSLVIVHDGDADWTNSFYESRTHTNFDGKTETYVGHCSIDTRNYNVILRDTRNKFEVKLDSVNRDSDAMLKLSLEWFKKVTGSKIFGFFLIAGNPRYMKGAIWNRYVFEDGKSFNDLNIEAKMNPQNFYEMREVLMEKQKMLMKKLKSEKFLNSNSDGYNSFYLVAGGDDLKTESDEIEIEGKFTTNKLKTAFMKMNKKKAISRVLVSKFIQGIAA